MISPTGSKVFVEMVLPGLQQTGGIFWQPSSNPSQCEAIVIGAGPKCKEVQVGDRVIYHRHGEVREMPGKDSRTRVEIVDESAVLCKIE